MNDILLPHYAKQQDIDAADVRVNCLDWSISGELTLHVEALCLFYQGSEIRLEQLTYQYSKNHLTIALLSVNHQPPGNKPATPPAVIEWQIPQHMPTLTLQQLVVTTPPLAVPLKLSLQSTTPNRLSLEGDIQGAIELSSSFISGQIDWQPASIERWLGLAPTFTGAISSELHFDGKQLESQHQLSLQGDLSIIQDCPLAITAQGNASLTADIMQQQLQLDLAQLEHLITVANTCPALIALPEPWQFEAANLEFTQPLTLSSQGITANHIGFRLHKHGQQTLTLFNAEQLQLNLGAEAGNFSYGITLADDHPLSGHSKGLITVLDDHFSIKGDSNHLTLSAWPLKEWALNEWKLSPLHTDFQFQYAKAASAEASAELTASMQMDSVHYQGLLLAENKLEVAVRLQEKQITGESTAQIATLSNEKITASTLKNALRFSISSRDNKLVIEGDSTIGQISWQNTPLTHLSIHHQHSQQLTEQSGITGQHNITIAEGFRVAVNQQNQQAQVNIAPQSLLSLNTLINNLSRDTRLTDGQIVGQANINLSSMHIDGRLQLKDIGGEYQDYILTGLNFSPEFQHNAKGLHIANGDIHIERLFTGIEVSKISGHLVSQPQLSLRAFKAQVFDGLITTEQIALTTEPQQFDLIVQQLDAEKILELEQQSGIQFISRLSGRLPLSINTQGIELNDGELHNEGKAKLLITDNAAFESVKAQQQELGQVLSLLQDLDIHTLSSAVNLNTEGWLSLDIAIKGHNAQQQQAVNFNYNHEENIFTLMRAIRMGDIIEDKVRAQQQ